MLRKLSTLLAILFLLAATHVFAQGFDFNLGGLGSTGPTISARALSNVDLLLPGMDAKIVVELTINSRYHVQSATTEKPYIPLQLTAVANPPAGIDIGPIQFPKPKIIPTPPGLGTGTLSVNEGKVFLLVPFKVAADAPLGDRIIQLTLVTQACDDKSCEPPKTTKLTVPLKIAPVGAKQTDTNAAVFTAAGKQEYVLGPPPAPPETAPAGVITQTAASENLLSNDEQLALIKTRPYAPFNHQEHEHSLAGIVLLALVGGVILNIMPCVLPVIPLKVLSLVQQAHGDRRVALMHAFTFSAGVIALFVLLAVVLRTFGLFYGQQFQSPAFLITMAMFVVALSLSMLSVWTINPPQAVYDVDAGAAQHSGYLGSFTSGLMATLLATPCSAPYLGPVLAWALIQPAWLTAFALALVGVGMSLPYLFLAAFPQLLAKIPRAGRWSELLKQGLGIVMLGVAVYLITLVPNIQLWPWVMVGGVVVALVCWGWGQIPSPIMDRSKIWGIRSIVLAVGFILGLFVYQFGSRAANASAAIAGEWEPFNIALLDEALKSGRPVVVDWTADWCINCRVLEATVLSKEGVKKAFSDNHALLLRADLSQDNPPASELNRALGGEAIPVLAIFSPGHPTAPVVLRDSYSQTRVIDEVTKAR